MKLVLIDPEALDDKATAWVNEVVPKMYEVLERAQITYSEDLLCESLSDGFKAGYVTAFTDFDLESKKEK